MSTDNQSRSRRSSLKSLRSVKQRNKVTPGDHKQSMSTLPVPAGRTTLTTDVTGKTLTTTKTGTQKGTKTGQSVHTYQEPASFVHPSTKPQGEKPVWAFCHQCKNSGMTKVVWKRGKKAWILFIVLLILFWPLCFLPLFWKKFHEPRQICPACGAMYPNAGPKVDKQTKNNKDVNNNIP